MCIAGYFLNVSFKSVIPNTTDPYQFAYRENRSVDEAVCLALNSVYKHLDERNT